MSNLYWYILDPLDVLLLRESKPFSPADGSWAKGLFPPMPITVFQALRAALPEQTQGNHNLELLGPFLLQDTPEGHILWLPTPKDLLAVFDHSSDDSEQFAKNPTPGWQSTARLQPLDDCYHDHAFLGFDVTQFAASDLMPMVPPGNQGYGRLFNWMRAEALAQYLSGNWQQFQEQDFHAGDPWSFQVLPHIDMQSGTRQVKSVNGYFTEVAIRLNQDWKLVAGFSEVLDPTVVRLGGEGHRVLVTPLHRAPPAWEKLEPYRQPTTFSETAYLLTPGLAENGVPHVYGVYPASWKSKLRGCVSDRPILAGGISKFQKIDQPQSAAFTPQRAFVPPGTVYRFKSESAPVNGKARLLPIGDENWLKTLQTLGYGTLLWSRTTDEH